MNQKNRYTDKINWTIILFFIVGVILVIIGGYAHPQQWSAVVLKTFVLTGACTAIASLIAFFLGR